MTHLLDCTRTAAGGVVGATVGSSSLEGHRDGRGCYRSAIGIGLSGMALNPSWFAAQPQ